MPLIKGIILLLSLLLLGIAILFGNFVYETYSFRQRDMNTDAIVVLTGGMGRVEEGIKLYRQHHADWLFLVGVDPSVRKGELYPDVPGNRDGTGVVLEKVSRNTLENALLAREVIVRKKVGSIRLITSRYHMKRAILIFKNVLPKNIAIYPHPVDSKNLKEAWWNHRGSSRLLLGEFYKYCMFRFFFLFASGELRPISIL